ncbi:MAG: ABC transporter permease [Clostridia bacterium]|nr:ABC transporter permease [Clostridia bacterium]
MSKKEIAVNSVQEEKILSPMAMAMKRFWRNKLAIIGLVTLAVVTLLCIFGPMLSPYEILQTNIINAKKPPSMEHWLGTDVAGRDVLLRLLYGGRISILVGVVSTLITVVIGVVIGGIAGFYGGKIDAFLMRVTDVFMSLPLMPILLVLASIISDLRVPPEERIYSVMFIIGILTWPTLARLVRGQILSLREQEFMMATEALGIRDSRKIFRHLIPNVIPVIIVTATIGISGSIILESTLSFLGLGVAPPYPSWGNMVNVVNDFKEFRLRPWLWVPPGVMIFITTMAINFVGNGLRDAFDPKMKR